jgi:hypothetical protein
VEPELSSSEEEEQRFTPKPDTPTKADYDNFETSKNIDMMFA